MLREEDVWVKVEEHSRTTLSRPGGGAGAVEGAGPPRPAV